MSKCLNTTYNPQAGRMDLSDGGIMFSLQLSLLVYFIALLTFWILRRSSRHSTAAPEMEVPGLSGSSSSSHMGLSEEDSLLPRSGQASGGMSEEIEHRRGWFEARGSAEYTPSSSPVRDGAVEGREQDEFARDNSQTRIDGSSGAKLPSTGPQSSSGCCSAPFGLFGWMGATLRISDAEIQTKCGVDAVLYLKFQVILMQLTGIMTLFSVGLIIPLNVSGGEHYHNMASTTITNLNPTSWKMWVQTGFFILYSVLGWLFFTNFIRIVGRIYTNSTKKTLPTTLMISNMPTTVCDPDLVRKHFESLYRGVEIADVRLVPDVDRLSVLHQKKIQAEHKLERYETIFSHTGRRPQINISSPMNWCDGNWACCFCCCTALCGKRVDAIEYYDDRSEHYCRKFEAILDKELELIGVAFVTFKHRADFLRAYRDSHSSVPRISHLSSHLGSDQWIVSVAPAPTDVVWTHLKDDHVYWYARFFLVNFMLLIVLLFWTTPVAILSALGPLKQADIFSGVSQYIAKSPFLTAYLPTLMMWLLTLLLPWIVAASSLLEFHHAKSRMELSVVRKSYAYYILNVIILPSFFMTSVDAILRLSKDKEEFIGKFECVFLANNGAFFVNYLIIASFIGNSFELLRLPEIILFKIYSFGAYTAKEKFEAFKSASFSFYYGREYSYLLCIFCMVMVFSTTCPLVVPGGFVYFTVKHVVDKYNLYNVRLHEYESDGSIVNTVSNQYLTSMLVSQIMFLGLYTAKLGSDSLQTFLVACVVVLNALFMIGKRFKLKKINAYDEEIAHADGDATPLDPESDPLNDSQPPAQHTPYLPSILQDYRTLNNPSSSSRGAIS
eukprot:Nk52_evm17s2011 gene=Nk52_evmTU17s2011